MDGVWEEGFWVDHRHLDGIAAPLETYGLCTVNYLLRGVGLCSCLSGTFSMQKRVVTCEKVDGMRC